MCKIFSYTNICLKYVTSKTNWENFNRRMTYSVYNQNKIPILNQIEGFETFSDHIYNSVSKLPCFSIYKAHPMYNAHPKRFRHSF
jgi:hypothetical protein